MLNYDWLLGGEAVDTADAGEAGDASLGYFSRIWVAGWFQARFQLRPDDDDAPSSVYGVLFCGDACEVLLREGDSLCHYFWEGREPGQGSSSGGVPGEVVSHYYYYFRIF